MHSSAFCRELLFRRDKPGPFYEVCGRGVSPGTCFLDDRGAETKRVRVKMVLGEAYLKGILRPPPSGFVPEYVPHPHSSNFLLYLRERGVRQNWFIFGGVACAVYVFSSLQTMREKMGEKKYEEAIMSGHAPCKSRGSQRVST